MPNNNELSLTDIRNEIVKFNNDPTTQHLKRYYTEKTLPEILGVSRKETSHSKFLAWIFNPYESHGLQDFGVRRLLEIVITNRFWSTVNNQNQNLFDNIITGNFEVYKSRVHTEYAIKKPVGSIDLLIELELEISTEPNRFKTRIVIENKVLSKEGPEQTNRYWSYFNHLNDEYKNIFVYLTPISHLDLAELSEPECSNKNFIQINYQNLVDSLLEPALEQSIDSTTRVFIEQYIQTLSQPTLDAVNTQYEKGIIMAIGKNESALLKKFWDNNQNIILAALSSYISDPEQPEDEREVIKEALEIIRTTGRDRSQIKLTCNGQVYGPFIKADIGFKTVNCLNANYSLNPEDIKWLENNTTCQLPLIKAKDSMPSTEPEKKYKRKNEAELDLNGRKYYVARNWGVASRDEFIKLIQEKFEGMHYEIIPQAN